MVSLRLSHCHSASDTFIGRSCWRTRSRTARRTSSSFSRSCCAVFTSSSAAFRRMEGGGLAFSLLQAPQRSHFFSANGPSAETRPKSWPRSTSTMTGSSRWSGSSDGQVKYSRRFPLNRTSRRGVKSLLGQRTHGKVLFFAAFEEFVDLQLAELAEMALQRVAERCGGSFRIGVRAARRLGDDLVDHAEREAVLGGDLERFRCPLALARVLPENRGAALGRDDGIDGVLEHQHAIGEPDRERAARAAFTDDRGD